MLSMDITDNRFIEIELLTDSINEMMARCGEFVQKYPSNRYSNEIEEMRIKLAVAHRQSRIYTDNKSVEQINTLLHRADDLMREGIVENVDWSYPGNQLRPGNR